MKRKTLKIKNKKATIHIIAKTKEMKLAEQNYKPDVWYDGSEKHITETRSYWEEPHAVEDMFNAFSPERALQVRELLIETFGTLDVGIEKVVDYEPTTSLAKAMAKVRKATQPLKETLDKAKLKAKLEAEKKDLKNLDRKLESIKLETKKHRLNSLVPLIDKNRVLHSIASSSLAVELKGRPANRKAPYDRPTIIGTGLTTYMARNKINTPVDIIKTYKKDSSIKVKTWPNLIWYLRQMNFEPDEVFNYALTAVAGTKERWNKHRIFREYENNESGAIIDMCREYKKHLKLKIPLKMFFGNDFFKKWCIDNNVLFSSEENFRQNLKKMVKEFNKKYPKDKIPEKLKVKP